MITTAQAMGGLRPAPRLVTKDMVQAMKPGSVIIDLAVESGGNVEGAIPGEEIEINGVKVIGLNNMPGQVARDASQMFSSNLHNLVLEYWDKEAAQFNLNLEDDILQGCVITHQGNIINAMTKKERGLYNGRDLSWIYSYAFNLFRF